MLFHTTNFAVFFASFCILYFSARDTTARIWVLLIFSNIFYGSWSWKYLGLLWLAILIDFSIAKNMGKTNDDRFRKFLVSLSIICNLGVLAFFKYFNFFISGLDAAGFNSAANWYMTDLVLPVGLSFYTFQSMSYTIDVYRRRQPPINNLLPFAAYVCYFPQLVAGPIERANHLLPQILSPAKPTRSSISSGILLFCMGFFRKTLADTFALLVDPIFANLAHSEPVFVILSIFGFGLQIYLDFSGYTDMARGISKLMGVELMKNFRSPYLSLSPKEFWRRWHISLSQWLRDYLYVPLGGNRGAQFNHLSNLMLTMILGGLWHGAGVNFLVWGGLHGAYLCIQTTTSKLKIIGFANNSIFQFVSSIISWFLTWIAVNYAWLYFRCPTFADAAIANQKIFEWARSPELPTILPGIALISLLIFFMDATIRLSENSQGSPTFSNLKLVAMDIFSGAFFVIGFILLIGVPTQQFIYFQF